MRVIESGLGVRECNAIFEARTLYEEIERLKESISDLNEKTISSPCLTGMPHGVGESDRMVERLIRMQKLQSRLEYKTRKLAGARRAAKAAVENIKSVGMRVFCTAYYLDAMEFEVAQQISGVSRGRCLEYRNRIELM